MSEMSHHFNTTTSNIHTADIMDESDFSVLVEVPEGKFYGIPYFSKRLDNYVIDAEWKKYGTQRWTEPLVPMLDHYDDLFATINTPEILEKLSPKTYNYISNELRVSVTVPPEKEPIFASFVDFFNRRDPLKRIGIVISCKHPAQRVCYQWEVEEFGIARVGHIDFERVKEYKPHKNESHKQYMQRLFRNTRGNVGDLAATDDYRILFKKSAMADGWPYDFLQARIFYKDLLIQQKDEELRKYQDEILVFVSVAAS